MKLLDGLFLEVHTASGENVVGHSDYTSLDDLREHMMRNGAWLRLKDVHLSDADGFSHPNASAPHPNSTETIDEYNIKCDKIEMWKTTYEV